MDKARRAVIKIAGLGVLGGGLVGLGAHGAKSAQPTPPAGSKPGDMTPIPGGLAGKRWAMVVDPFACKDGCVDCIAACHKAHNVPQMKEPRHEIKWIWTEKYEHAFPTEENEHLSEKHHKALYTLMCNHCDNPPCVRVCPTQATFRRPDGIVMMDFHRCIGCRFCMAACPFGARSFNFRDPRPFIKEPTRDYPTRAKGVVEKCTFCDERLARGQLPACVEACKTKCLVFGDLADPKSEVSKLLKERYAIRRKPQLGTMPSVFYLV